MGGDNRIRCCSTAKMNLRGQGGEAQEARRRRSGGVFGVEAVMSPEC